MAELRAHVQSGTPPTTRQIRQTDTLAVGGGITSEPSVSTDLVISASSSNVVLAANKNFNAAAGTGNFDFSAASGTFKTTTGAVTIGPGAVTVSGATTFTGAGTAVTINNNAVVSGVLNTDGGIQRSGAGNIDIGTTANTNGINIGRVGQLVTIKGDLQVDGAETFVGGATFQADATFQGNVTFGNDAADTVAFISKLGPAANPNVHFLKEQDHVIDVDASTTGNTVGGALDIKAGNGTGTADGGQISLVAGEALATGAGGAAFIQAGTAGDTGAGGVAGVYGGASVNGTGGNVEIFAGAGTSNGSILIGTTATAAITVGATGITTTVAGVLTVTETTNLNGNVNLGNTAADLINFGGQVNSNIVFTELNAGYLISVEDSTSGAGGGLTIEGADGQGTGAGGMVALFAGAGGATGPGGAINIDAGVALGPTAPGGSVNINAGDNTGADGGSGGSWNATAGDGASKVGAFGGQGGAFNFTGGTGGDNLLAAAGSGGASTTYGGNGGNTDTGTAGSGGDWSGHGGAGGNSSDTANGGVGGAAIVAGGVGGSSVNGTDGVGGLALLAGGGGGGSNGNGGNTVVRAGGAAGAGTHGVVQIGLTNTSAITIGASGVTTTVAGLLTLGDQLNINGSSTGATVTGTNLNTLTNGGNADALHVHTGVATSTLVATGLTTTGLASGDAGYISANNTLSKTDATTIATARFFGVNTGTAGSMVTDGTATFKFTTDGGSPNPGDPVYLALLSEDTNTGAGKLTATAPSAALEVVYEVGIVVDNSLYAGSKTCVVLIQPKMPIINLAVRLRRTRRGWTRGGYHPLPLRG